MDAIAASIRLPRPDSRIASRSRPRSARRTMMPILGTVPDRWPSDQVIDTAAPPCVVEDFAARSPAADPPALRSAAAASACRCWLRTNCSGRSEHRGERSAPVRAGRSAVWSGSSPVRSPSPSRTRSCTTCCAAASGSGKTTFDAISDPIAVFNGHGALLRGNAALAALVGRPVSELAGITLP